MFAGIVFLPLLGAIVAGFFGRVIGDRAAQWVTCAMMLVSMLLSIIVFIDVALGGNARTVELFTWIQSGDLDVSWALKVDTLTAVMLIVVTVVSSMVHVYSVGYMSHDPAIPRFMAYLSLFTFFMLMLVTADNLIQLFFGWEGVGLASYLLIGFWFHKPTANAAAIKAFLVNRVGDFGFMLGIFGCFMLFDTVNFDQLFQAAPEAVGQKINFLGMHLEALTTVCLLLFVGAMGKSAQFLLHTWLPDAMEGPTPVSALIHAATMVTAGVFMVARLSPMFEYAPQALMVVTFIGAITAIFAATVGLVQNDIKRIIAYSTCSQLGYMFFAIGVSAYSAAIFHLMTHAFFKALLFLGAGSVIHAMSDEQDIRKMGGIWKLIPLTYGLMWIGSLALAGVPFFAGFYSKDIIIESAFASGTDIGRFAFWIGIVAAFLTAFYSWRLLLLTFHGKPRASHHTMEHVHESPKVMTIPLIVLAIGAIFAGFVGYESFVGDGRAAFWGSSILVLEGKDVIEAAHHVPLWVKLLPIVV
ncbi:MAG: NADH-quinone oxidoreductase subunit L, partial [Alphaproteobacteria bacterium]|nr:NADH-quinone oxidoreductase subunit L [Alphaproteobacteria bacterium]